MSSFKLAAFIQDHVRFGHCSQWSINWGEITFDDNPLTKYHNQNVELPFQEGTENRNFFLSAVNDPLYFNLNETIWQTRKHSSRMCTGRFSTTRTLTTRYQYWWGGGPQINKFEQVSSDYHQMSLAGGRVGVPCLMVWYPGGRSGDIVQWGPMHHG